METLLLTVQYPLQYLRLARMIALDPSALESPTEVATIDTADVALSRGQPRRQHRANTLSPLKPPHMIGFKPLSLSHRHDMLRTVHNLTA